MTVVVDADVVIGALERGDVHHAEVRTLFEGWREARTHRLMSLPNLSEVLVGVAMDPRRLATAREALRALGVSPTVPNEAIAVDAARLRAAHPISLPDAYLLATARHHDARVCSFDRKVLRAAHDELLPVVG